MSKKVFVWLKPQFLGDAVMACPMIDSLVESRAQTIVRANKAVQQVLADRETKLFFTAGGKIKGIRQVLDAAKELKAAKPDAVILVNRSFRSALAARIAGVPMRIGHATEGRGPLLTHRIAYDEAKFEAECYLDLLDPLAVEKKEPRPKLAVSEEERVAGARLLCDETISIGLGEKLLYDATIPNDEQIILLRDTTIGVQPGARYPEKQLPISTLAEVARALVERGFHIAALGGTDEIDDVVKFQEAVGSPIVNLVGKTTIRESLAVLSNLRTMVGSDTGLMHLAAALGCPTVTVFGPNPISKWGHQYTPHRPIAAPEGMPSRVTTDELLKAI